MTYGEWTEKHGDEPIGKKTIWCRLGQHTFYTGHFSKTGRHICLQCGMTVGDYKIETTLLKLEEYTVIENGEYKTIKG